MARFEVTLTYKMEYVSVLTVSAKDEDVAREKVEKLLDGVVVDQQSFITFCTKHKGDVDIQDDTWEIDDVVEVD